MKRTGRLMFVGAAGLALALYGLSLPDGLPWNASSHWAMAYLGEIVRLPEMPHPVWGYYVQVFGSAVALSVALAAAAAGAVAAGVGRLLDWRWATAAALGWIFMPGVWNRAVTGERSLCLASVAVVAAWAVGAAAWTVFRRTRRGGESAFGAVRGICARLARVNRIAGWGAMGAAAVFAVVSAATHDHRLGEAASAYARGVAAEAAGRIVVLDGLCDDQMVQALDGGADGGRLRAVALRTDDAYRTHLVAQVRREWPAETNLWVAAQIGAAAFVEAAAKRFPERFYRMGARSATRAAWERRWNGFAPYLKSSDPFVRVARQAFGREGNAVANALGDGPAEAREAWRLYRRICEEIDPGNLSARVNMGERIRRGYAADASERAKVDAALERAVREAGSPEGLRAQVRAAGAVRIDAEDLARLEAGLRKRLAARVAAGEKVEVSPEVLSLVEWNNEMVSAMELGQIVRAGRLARKILSNPRWHGFQSANAVMGSVAASEGDYVAGEAFFRVATDTTNAVPAIVLNDYADTLLRLGKLDEAEKAARRAVAASGESFWLARLTLAQVLRGRGRPSSEWLALLDSVRMYAPDAVREQVRAPGQAGGLQ